MGLHIPIFATAIMIAGITIDEKTALPIGTCAAVGVGVWWMGRKLQSIEDNQAKVKEDLVRVEKQHMESMAGIRKAIDELPCCGHHNKIHNCPENEL